MAIATFAAGCFWGVEHDFRQIPGVLSTEVGYTGGHTENATYKEVCSGTTGHAEAVNVEFDPSVVSFEELVGAFWALHDPTQINRQGPDLGTQYRSAIFYHDDEQRALAEASKQAVNDSGRLTRPIATEITEAGPFWKAEDYHQQYVEKRGGISCH
jgi:peptide-methionine (S)-S-oxide reductase